MGKKTRKRLLNKEIQKAYRWYSTESLLRNKSSKERLIMVSNRLQLQRNTAIRLKRSPSTNLCNQCGALGTNIRFRIYHQTLIKTCLSCKLKIRRPLRKKRSIPKVK